MRLSALEQIPLFAGHDPRTTLEETVRLARGLEEAGYHRFWLAEHQTPPPSSPPRRTCS